MRLILFAIALAACGHHSNFDQKKVDAVRAKIASCPLGSGALDCLHAAQAEMHSISGGDLSTAESKILWDNNKQIDELVKVAEQAAAEAKAKPTATPTAPPGAAQLTRAEIFGTMWTLCKLAFSAEHPDANGAAAVARGWKTVQDHAAQVGVTLTAWPHETGKPEDDRRAKIGYMFDAAGKLNDAMGKYPDSSLALIMVGVEACVLDVDYGPGGDQPLLLRAAKDLVAGGHKAKINDELMRPIAAGIDQKVSVGVMRERVEDFATLISALLKDG